MGGSIKHESVVVQPNRKVLMLEENVSEKERPVNLSRSVLEAATWLEQQIREVRFGSCGVELTVHNGKITRVARSVVTSELGGGVSR